MPGSTNGVADRAISTAEAGASAFLEGQAGTLAASFITPASTP
jgi:hypothetical protein